jgi:hypothetical protein
MESCRTTGRCARLGASTPPRSRSRATRNNQGRRRRWTALRDCHAGKRLTRPAAAGARSLFCTCRSSTRCRCPCPTAFTRILAKRGEWPISSSSNIPPGTTPARGSRGGGKPGWPGRGGGPFTSLRGDPTGSPSRPGQTPVPPDRPDCLLSRAGPAPVPQRTGSRPAADRLASGPAPRPAPSQPGSGPPSPPSAPARHSRQRDPRFSNGLGTRSAAGSRRSRRNYCVAGARGPRTGYRSGGTSYGAETR